MIQPRAAKPGGRSPGEKAAEVRKNEMSGKEEFQPLPVVCGSYSQALSPA